MATIVYVRISGIDYDNGDMLNLSIQGQTFGDNLASLGGSFDVSPGASASDILDGVAQRVVDSLAINSMTLNPETDSIILLHDIDLVSLTIPT